MSAPGWYPDPSGVSGQYRYWDGSNWTNQVTTQPAGSWSAPPSPLSTTNRGTSSRGMSDGGTSSRGMSSRRMSDGGDPRPKERRTGRRWLIALIAVAAALVVVIVLAVRGLGGALPGMPDTPGGQPSDNVCPSPEPDSSPTQPPNDGRVHSGRLSFPMLPAPWGAPTTADDVPFGRDVQQQFVETEQTSKLTWGAAVMVGELVAGDGFFAPKDGAEIVLRCVTGTFYGDAAVTRHDTKSQAMTVDGHDAWIMESDLSFSIPGLQATNELLTVVIVDLNDGTAGLFASSVPGNTPQYNEPARRALQDLRVS